MTLSDYLNERNIPEDSEAANYILEGYRFATNKEKRFLLYCYDFVQLVSMMRAAQKKFGGEVDVCIGFEEGLEEMYRLEDKVDEFLMKEIQNVVEEK
jgi:hypothetical protein